MEMNTEGIVAVLYFVLKSIGCFLLALFLGFVFYLYSVHSKFDHIPGPTRSSFFMGNLMDIRKKRVNEGKNIHQTLAEWSTEYRPIFVIWFVHIPLAVVSDANIVREVLAVKNLPKDPFGYERMQYVFGQRFLGRGLFTDLNRATWESKRRTLNPAFNRNKLFNDLKTMNSCCENFIHRLENLADGKTEVSMADEFLVIALETLVKTAFSMDMDQTEISSFQSNFKNALIGVVQSFRSPLTNYMLWSYLRRKCISGAKQSRKVAQSILEKRQKDIDDGHVTPDDMLSYVFKLKELPECDFNDLIDMVVTLVFGGMETMANHMAFTLLSICLHPDVELRLKKELNDVIGERKEVSAEDIRSLPYLENVLKEALRLHPPTTAVTRITEKDMRLGDVLIPANTPIMVNPFVLQHHPDYWDNPHTFQPDRFDYVDKLHPYAYFPFSLGPRRCIGASFAELEVKLVIVRLLKRFAFDLLPGQSLDVAEGISFCPTNWVRCTLKPL